MSESIPYSHTVFETTIHAKLYTQFRPVLPQSVLNYVLDSLKKHIVPEQWQIAIDIGCGGGQSTKVLAKHFEKVYGFDISRAQIEKAIESEHPNNVCYEISSAENIPSINSNSVQLLIGCQSAHWFDLEKFFIEANRILVPNGMVALIGYTMFEPVDPSQPEDQSLTQLLLNLRTDPILVPYKLPNTVHNDNRYTDIIFPNCFQYSYKDNLMNQMGSRAQDIVGFIESWSPYQQLFKSSESEAQKFLQSFEQKIKNILNVKDLNEKQLLFNYRYYVAMGRKK